MMVGACYTLFRMRKNLAIGMKRAVADLKKSAAPAGDGQPHRTRPEPKVVFGGSA